MTDADDVEVLIVGAGPTGLTLANILGQAGVRTLVIDREATTVQAPRAVSIDDEALRVMQSVGIADAVISDVLPNYGTRYRSPWGSQFAFVHPVTREYGFPRRSAFRQPDLEETLLQALTRFPSVKALFGHALVGLTEPGSDRPVAKVEHDGVVSDIRARFVVGADGASSTVRRLLGIKLEGTTFEQRWLVVDGEADDDDSYHTVAYCDHRRPAISLPGPHGTRRWEVLLGPRETEDEVLDPAWVEPVIRGMGATPPRSVVRRAVYSFHARIARQWRQDSVFLAGDAAHLTPPYAGQGMNAGIRDAANLGWKLATALHGLMDVDALDSYEAERKSHAWAMIQLALTIGRVMTPSSALQSYGRAALFHLVTVAPFVKKYLLEMRFKPRPRFQTGLVVPDGVRDSVVGRMFPQPLVGRESGAPVLLDDIIGPGFALVRFGTPFPPGADAWLKELEPRLIRILPAGRRPLGASAGCAEVRDEGDLTQRFRQYADRVLLVRPDRYVAGSFTDPEAEPFAARYRTLLRS